MRTRLHPRGDLAHGHSENARENWALRPRSAPARGRRARTEGGAAVRAMRTRLVITLAVAAIAAAGATGAFGVSGGATITTIAGSGKPGFSGDGGSALAAQLRSVDEVAVDRQGNVWVTDGIPPGALAQAAAGRGHVVVKFSPEGKVLLTLGKVGVTGDGPDTFNQPSDVVTAPNGDIFVADGHGGNTNARIVKFSKDGKFIKTWGKKGAGPGELDTPHAIAMDSKGRLFVGDRRLGGRGLGQGLGQAERAGLARRGRVGAAGQEEQHREHDRDFSWGGGTFRQARERPTRTARGTVRDGCARSRGARVGIRSSTPDRDQRRSDRRPGPGT